METNLPPVPKNSSITVGANSRAIDQLPPANMEATVARHQRWLQLIYFGLSGFGIGGFVGLSHSPLVGSVVPILLALSVCALVLYAGLPLSALPWKSLLKPTEQGRNQWTGNAGPIALFVNCALLGSIVGFSARLNNWLGPTLILASSNQSGIQNPGVSPAGPSGGPILLGLHAFPSKKSVERLRSMPQDLLETEMAASHNPVLRRWAMTYSGKPEILQALIKEMPCSED